MKEPGATLVLAAATVCAQANRASVAGRWVRQRTDSPSAASTIWSIAPVSSRVPLANVGTVHPAAALASGALLQLREQFRVRFNGRFYDTAFGAERDAIARLEAIAWDAVQEGRKAPITR